MFKTREILKHKTVDTGSYTNVLNVTLCHALASLYAFIYIHVNTFRNKDKMEGKRRRNQILVLLLTTLISDR